MDHTFHIFGHGVQTQTRIPKPNPKLLSRVPNPKLISRKPDPKLISRKPNPKLISRKPNPKLISRNPNPKPISRKPNPKPMSQTQSRTYIPNPIPRLSTPNPIPNLHPDLKPTPQIKSQPYSVSQVGSVSIILDIGLPVRNQKCLWSSLLSHLIISANTCKWFQIFGLWIGRHSLSMSLSSKVIWRRQPYCEKGL